MQAALEFDSLAGHQVEVAFHCGFGQQQEDAAVPVDQADLPHPGLARLGQTGVEGVQQGQAEPVLPIDLKQVLGRRPVGLGHGVVHGRKNFPPFLVQILEHGCSFSSRLIVV